MDFRTRLRNVCSACLVGGGLMFAGGGVNAAPLHLLLESDTNTTGGSELFAASYNSYADFLSNNIASSAFSAIDISASFSAAGFASDWTPAGPGPDPSQIPEPSGLALVVAGLAEALVVGLRRRQFAGAA